MREPIEASGTYAHSAVDREGFGTVGVSRSAWALCAGKAKGAGTLLCAVCGAEERISVLDSISSGSSEDSTLCSLLLGVRHIHEGSRC